MLIHFHRDRQHLDSFTSQEAGYLVSLYLKEKARCPVGRVEMKHYDKARLRVHRVDNDPCIFCGVVGCTTNHLVLSSSEDSE